MRTRETEYLDGEFTVQEQTPATFPELSEIIGEDAIVTEAVSNLYYRNKYPRVYKKVSDEVAALGFPKAVKATKTLKDGTISKVYESDNDHLRAALVGRFEPNPEDETKPIKVSDGLPNGREKLEELFTKYGTTEPLYVKGERTGGTGRISAEAMDTANKFFAAGDEKVEKVASHIESQVPQYKIGRDAENAVTPEALARGIMALERHLQAQAKKAAAAALAI